MAAPTAIPRDYYGRAGQTLNSGDAPFFRGRAGSVMVTGFAGTLEAQGSTDYEAPGQTGSVGVSGSAGTLISGTFNDLSTLPDWNDEQAAYQSRGLALTDVETEYLGDGFEPAGDITTYISKTNFTNFHNDTEGDPLWIADQQSQRLAGIHPIGAANFAARRDSLLPWFKSGYRGGTAWQDEEEGDAGHDHLYARGLVEYGARAPDAAALNEAEAIVDEMITWFGPGGSDPEEPPNASLFWNGNAGRRWSRQLHIAVLLQKHQPRAASKTWRDKVIDLIMTETSWDTTYLMWPLGTTQTDSRLGSGSHAAGDRIMTSFHMGYMMEALWLAFLELDRESDSRASDVGDRLIDLATHYRDIPLTDIGGGVQGIGRVTGYNLNTTASINEEVGTIGGEYMITPCGGLICAYKLTATQSYVDRAWLLMENWQERLHLLDGTPSPAGKLHHYVDSKTSSGDGHVLLENNKGELQYVYPIFEGGGVYTLYPGVQSALQGVTGAVGVSGNAGTLVGQPLVGQTGSVGVTGNRGALESLRPSWIATRNDKTWIQIPAENTFLDVDPEEDSAWEGPIANPNWDFDFPVGSDYHTAVIDNWNTMIMRLRFLVVVISGGHFGSQQNTCYEFGPFTAELLKWTWFGNEQSKYEVPSHTGAAVAGETPIADWSAEQGKQYYEDEKPASDHNYDRMCYIPTKREVFRPYTYTTFNPTGGTGGFKGAGWLVTDENDVGGSYLPDGHYPDYPGDQRNAGGGAEYDSAQDKVRIIDPRGPNRRMRTYDPVLNAYTSHSPTIPSSVLQDSGGVALDPVREVFYMHTRDQELVVCDLSAGREGENVLITSNYSGALITTDNIGFEYEPIGGECFGYAGGQTLYQLVVPSNYRNGDGSLNSGASYSWSAVTNGAGSDTVGPDGPNGIYGRFRYQPEIKAFVYLPRANGDVWAYRIPESTGLAA